MSHRPFSPALLLKLPQSGTYVADSVWELEQYIDLFWPEDDPEREALLWACREALDGWVNPEKVREKAWEAAHRLGLIARRRGMVHYRSVDNHSASAA